MVGCASAFIEICLILFSFFGGLKSFTFEECGQYGLFFYSDGNCYFFRPANLTGVEGCQEFDPGMFNPIDRLQGIVMEKEESSYFWSDRQQERVAYYVKPHESRRIQEKKCPRNFGPLVVDKIWITSFEICLVFLRREVFVNGFKLENVDGSRVIDQVSDAKSSMILFLIRERDDPKFFYTNNDTSKLGTITIELPQNRTKGSIHGSYQTCKNESFILIQNEESKQIQIYVYSILRIIKAIEQGNISYSLHLTHSLEFQSLVKSKDRKHSIMIRYPYMLRAFMLILVDEKRWYLIIPNIPYSTHIVAGCNVQGGKNGSRTAVCSESYSQSYQLFPFVHLGRLGVHTASRSSASPNASFKFESHFVATCYLMNDCYGCRLADPLKCSWDGEKCIPSNFQESFKECVSSTNISENNGTLKVGVRGVRLTNTFMKVHILTTGGDKIKPISIQDHGAIFLPPYSILVDWKAEEVDLFLVIDNEIIENSVVQLNLKETGESPSNSHLIFWLIVLILIVLLLIFAFRKFSQYIRALQGSAIELSSSSLTQSNLLYTSESPVEFSVFARDTGFRASQISTFEEAIRKEKEYSNAKKATTQSSDSSDNT